MATVRFESLEEAQAKTSSEGAKWRLEKEHLAREYCIAVEEVKIMQEKLRECYIKEGVNYKVRPPPRRPRRQLPPLSPPLSTPSHAPPSPPPPLTSAPAPAPLPPPPRKP